MCCATELHVFFAAIDCETIIWWAGDSDSVQRGFVIPADLLKDLASLGCDFYGTAHLEDDADDK